MAAHLDETPGEPAPVLPHDSDNPFRAPSSASTPGPATEDAAPGSRLLGHYLRLVGGLQLLYGLVFGRITIEQARFLLENGLDLNSPWGRFAVVVGPSCALITLACSVAGYGTLRRRRWCRGWQVVYLGACVSFLVAGTAYEWIRHGRAPEDTASLLAFSIPLMLPYVPIVFWRKWPWAPAATPLQTGAEGE